MSTSVSKVILTIGTRNVSQNHWIARLLGKELHNCEFSEDVYCTHNLNIEHWQCQISVMATRTEMQIAKSDNLVRTWDIDSKEGWTAWVEAGVNRLHLGRGFLIGQQAGGGRSAGGTY